MTCFEFRRLLLAHPREKTAEQAEHLAHCPQCAAAAAQAEAFEARLQDVLRVPVPDGLADKILLRQKMQPGLGHSLRARAAALVSGLTRRPRLQYGLWAAAAVVVIGIALGLQAYRSYDPEYESLSTAIAVGRDNPAVIAISFVLDHEPRLLKENRSGDPQVMMDAFRRVALKYPGDGVSVRYLGKCPAPGGTGEHVVLTTPYGQVTLILVPDFSVGSRIMVADRKMTALANPVGKGGYILVARSPRTIREVERMLGV